MEFSKFIKEEIDDSLFKKGNGCNTIVKQEEEILDAYEMKPVFSKTSEKVTSALFLCF